jgi:predicted ArsR family transcriptional regulator
MSSHSLFNSEPGQPSTAERLLFLLKTRGVQTAAVLGQELKITKEGARQQLVRLAADGLVEPISEVRGVGRPVQSWKLSPRGQARFPNMHAELTVQMIQSIRSVLGEEALDRVIDAREQHTIRAYQTALRGAVSLQDKVSRLAVIRTREGYLAEWRKHHGGFLLIENHCPICAAATACTGFCRAELNVFRRVLGPGVELSRQEHLLAGARRCTYFIKATKRSG